MIDHHQEKHLKSGPRLNVQWDYVTYYSLCIWNLLYRLRLIEDYRLAWMWPRPLYKLTGIERRAEVFDVYFLLGTNLTISFQLVQELSNNTAWGGSRSLRTSRAISQRSNFWISYYVPYLISLLQTATKTLYRLIFELQLLAFSVPSQEIGRASCRERVFRAV